ncbi:MAG: penicillin-binding protein 2 [Tyzzerella sp.]|nr:penicillin-binding protein 2 [Tyzzerella sp.]
MQKKLVMLFVAIVLAFVFLIGRITYINAENGEKYTKIVLNQQQYNSRTIPFRRGDILDRNGTVIATSERVYNVILDAYVMLSGDDEEEREDTIDQVKEAVELCFGIDEDVIDEIIEEKPSSRYCILTKKISYDTAQKFVELEKDEENYPYISCLWLEEDYERTYPYNSLASDVIGFTVAGNVGNGGLEASYNSILNGTDGREYGYLDSDSNLERTVKAAVNGDTVVSTIDITLQSIVEKYILQFNEEHKNEVTQGPGSKNTAVIIADPNTGEILAEASYPNYDLNNPRDLSAYYSEEAIEAMSDEEFLENLNALWKNFCVSDTYEPGSTIKPFAMAIGLENGTLNGNEVYNCTGSKVVIEGTKPIHCHKRSGHGMQTLSDGIANSCNVVMMNIAASLGADEMCKYQTIFGFGQKTGIDLPGEAATEGLVFSPENMGPLELATSSFGQGFNVTATQMIAGFSSLINGGYYYEPHVVKQIQDENGNVLDNISPVLLKKTISAETSEMLKKYMLQTMTSGTGKGAQVEGYEIGAKTGTAEKLPRGNGKYLLSFMGFAPVENPEVLVYVVIDEPNVDDQSNSAYVRDLAKNIMTEAFPYLDITKTQTVEEPVTE